METEKLEKEVFSLREKCHKLSNSLMEQRGRFLVLESEAVTRKERIGELKKELQEVKDDNKNLAKQKEDIRVDRGGWR